MFKKKKYITIFKCTGNTLKGVKYGGRLIPYIVLCLFFSIEISIREPEQNS